MNRPGSTFVNFFEVAGGKIVSAEFQTYFGPSTCAGFGLATSNYATSTFHSKYEICNDADGVADLQNATLRFDEPVNVPLPASALLLLSSIAGIGGLFRKRKRSPSS